LVTQLGQQNGNLNLEPSCEDQKCPIFLQSHTSIPASLDSSLRNCVRCYQSRQYLHPRSRRILF
jgi:hypothetical protein